MMMNHKSWFEKSNTIKPKWMTPKNNNTQNRFYGKNQNKSFLFCFLNLVTHLSHNNHVTFLKILNLEKSSSGEVILAKNKE